MNDFSAPKPRKPPSPAAIRHARKWLKAMSAEARAREDYQQADDPRSRERARKRWLSVRHDWALIKMPGDEAIKAARQK